MSAPSTLRWALAAVAVVAVAMTAVAKEDKTARQARARLGQTAGLTVFHGTVEDARKEARERNVPLLVHIMVDTEVCSVAYLENVIGDSTLARMSARAVVMIGSDGAHAPATLEDDRDGETTQRTVCSVLPWFADCVAHETSRGEIWKAYKDASGDMRAPQTIIELAEGGISWRQDTATCPPVSAVIDALADAQTTSGKGLTIAEHIEVLAHIEDGQKALEKDDFPCALEHLHAALELAPDGPLGREIRPGHEKLAVVVEAIIEETLPLLVAGSAAAAYATLADVEDHVTGTQWARRVTQALDRAGRNTQLTAELAPAKVAREATGLLRTYRTQVAVGDERKAEQTLRRLLKPAYADTAAGKQAAEEHPDLAKKLRR